ncbi:hypothetical protein [Actibacterium sp. 188UL27-1]|uniref:hypothetical protein n=1 Tax=Actibacterium sp. 188UL27-1 TaxID=2786961 RepID=UPI0019578318|nr:hypothetical protein [Actibacterium sp. 188UL27-1]MBM7067852.1 hypothetical protein [Actibacterium sp. 188UL27-1]
MAGRSLTSGEIAMAQSVYKSTINCKKPRIFNEKWAFFQPDDRAMAPNGNIYFAPSDPGYQADFSARSVGIHDKATFIHELGHVWQHQQGQWVTVRGAVERDYDYLPLAASDDFDAYGIEQQAQIFRDYFYLLKGYSNSRWPARSVYEAVIPHLP